MIHLSHQVSCILDAMNLFSRKTSRSVALLDIGSSSIAGAYIVYGSDGIPTFYYTVRLPIETREEAAIEDDMLRTLEALTDLLVKEGAPVLREAVGSGNVDEVVASIGAPWQETTVRTESIEEENGFVFTKSILKKATEANNPGITEGRIESGESVVATVLNGYETSQPIGKQVKRADVVILSSTLDKKVASDVERTLRRAFHSHEVSLTAFAPVAYQVLKDLYPHQKDFLILDVSGTATDLAFVKSGLLVDVKCVHHGVQDLMKAARASGISGTGLTGLGADTGGIIDPARNAHFTTRVGSVQQAWLDGLKEALTEIGSRHPLPRSLFLLADEDVRDYLRRLLHNETLHSLWLSEEPLAITPVLREQLATSVTYRGAAEGDTYLAMLAVFCVKKFTSAGKK